MVNVDILSGVFPTGQMPLDAKRYYLTLAELADLGTGEFKAFYYYDRLKVLVLEDNSEYVWREEATSGETGGVVVTSFTYPANTITNGIDYSGKIFNFFPAVSSDIPAIPVIEDFGAVWSGTGLTYNCYANPYIIANQVYTAVPGQVTLGVAPSTIGEKRKDAIVADINGNFVVVPGTESPTPEDPDIDEDTQRLISIVLVEDNSLVPAGLVRIQVYDENVGEPNEWTASENTGALRIDLESTNSPSQNTKHIEGLITQTNDEVTFLNDEVQSFLSMSSISFDVQTPIVAGRCLVWFELNGVPVSNLAAVTVDAFGYQGVLAGYQSIGIPMGNFTLLGESFDSIVISFKGYNTPTIDLIRVDNVAIVYGGDPFSDGDNTWLGLYDTEDTDYFGKENYAGLVNSLENKLKLTRIPLFTDHFTGNAVINGGVDYLVDLDRRIWATLYIIDNELYDELVEGTVTHDVADALPRWDVYYIERLTPTSIPTVGIKKGTPDANPEKPTLDDPVKQVKAGEKLFIGSEPVTPPEIVEEILYDENLGTPTEWDVTNDANVLSNVSYGDGPYQGAVHIGFVAGDDPILWASIPIEIDNAGVTIPYDPISGSLVFALRFRGPWSNQARLNVNFIDTANGILTPLNNFNRNQLEGFGFDNDINDVWHIVSIPGNDIGFLGTEFDRLRITISNAPKGSIDYIRYITGVTGNPTPTNVTDVSIQDENQVEQFRMTDRLLFEGTTFDPVLKKVTVIPASGFEAINEGGGIGWRLIGRDPALFGNIGLDALDAGQNYSPSAVFGATGGVSRNFGEDCVISGYGAFGNGYLLNLTNTYTVGFGWDNNSAGYASLIGGVFNNETSGTGFNLTWGNGNIHDSCEASLIVGVALSQDDGNGTAVLGCANVPVVSGVSPGSNPLHPVLIVGNGTHTVTAGVPWTAGVRSNLIVGLRNGELVLPSTDIARINAEVTGRQVVTKEWVSASFVTSSIGIGTGSVLLLDNVLSTLYNHDSGDTKNYTSYSIAGGTIAGGRAMCRINAPSKPLVGGATLEEGFPFIPNVDMYLNVWSPDGTAIKYFFSPATIVQSVNRQQEYSTNGDKTLVSSDAGYLWLMNLTATNRSVKVDNELPQNGEVEFLNIGTKNVTFVLGTGAPAVLNTPDGTILIPGAACTLIRRGTTNEYWLKGELE